MLYVAKGDAFKVKKLLDEQPESTEADLHEPLRPILRNHFQPALAVTDSQAV